MKKILLLWLIIMGCAGEPPTYEESVKNTLTQKHMDLSELFVFEFDSCEYVGGYRSITHKGNCKYCLKRNQKLEL